MGGKYEVRYYQEDGEYTTHYTNSWFTYMILRFTKKLIYYKVYCD